MSQRQLPIIVALGTTQTLAWASSYYLPAILADVIAFIRALSLERVDLISFSLDGVVAQDVVLKAPRLIRKII